MSGLGLFIRLALLVYALGCQVALTVFAARLATERITYLIRFTSIHDFTDDLAAYVRDMVLHTLGWPFYLWRAARRVFV